MRGGWEDGGWGFGVWDIREGDEGGEGGGAGEVAWFGVYMVDWLVWGCDIGGSPKMFLEKGKMESFRACDRGCWGLFVVMFSMVDIWRGELRKGGSGD